LNNIHSNPHRPHYSNKARIVALLLCWFLGWLGAHRFYVGKVGTAILMILTFGGLGLWILIDLIVILVGSFRDRRGHVVFYWFEPHSLERDLDRDVTSRPD